jgi:protein-tyrosine-phosphatase
MAAAIYNKLTNTTDADSAGTYTGAPDEPEGLVLSEIYKTPHFFIAMEKHGLQIRHNLTKRLTPEMLAKADIVVSMAEEPYIPDFLKNESRVLWWDIPNPKEVDTFIAEETYRKLELLILNLISK